MFRDNFSLGLNRSRLCAGLRKEQPTNQKCTAGAPGVGQRCPQPPEGATDDDGRYTLSAAARRIRVPAPRCPWRLVLRSAALVPIVILSSFATP